MYLSRYRIIIDPTCPVNIHSPGAVITHNAAETATAVRQRPNGGSSLTGNYL